MTLPALHPKQAEVDRHPARFKVLVCGRRWGKTRLGVFRGLRGLFSGRRVWWIAPTYAQASIAWRLARPMAVQVPGVEVREADRALIAPGGGEFWFKSADRADNLRGEGIDDLIMDEADFQPRETWEQVLRPALADRRGGALLISTPNVEGGWFHELFERGQGTDPSWRSWSFPSATNPHLAPAEIEAARASLPSIVFRREFGAEFVSSAGARVQRAWLHRGEPPDGLEVAMGVDLAISTKQGADYTAAVVLGRVPEGQPTAGRIYVLDAQRTRVSFAQALAFVRSVAETWSPQSIVVEQVQYQAAAVQELLRTTDLPVRGVRPDKDKLTRFQPLEARYEHGLVWHAPGLAPEFERELLSFPVGDHDDLVDAAAYAYQALSQPAPYESSRVPSIRRF